MWLSSVRTKWFQKWKEVYLRGCRSDYSWNLCLQPLQLGFVLQLQPNYLHLLCFFHTKKTYVSHVCNLHTWPSSNTVLLHRVGERVRLWYDLYPKCGHEGTTGGCSGPQTGGDKLLPGQGWYREILELLKIVANFTYYMPLNPNRSCRLQAYGIASDSWCNKPRLSGCTLANSGDIILNLEWINLESWIFFSCQS